MGRKPFEYYFQDMEPFGCGPREFEPREEIYRRRGFCPLWSRNFQNEEWRDQGPWAQNWNRNRHDWREPSCRSRWNRWARDEGVPEWFDKHGSSDRRKFFERFGPRNIAHENWEGRCGKCDRDENWKNFFDSFRSNSFGPWNRDERWCDNRRDQFPDEDMKKFFEKFGPGLLRLWAGDHSHHDWRPKCFARRMDRCSEDDWNKMFGEPQRPWRPAQNEWGPWRFGERHSEEDWKNFFEKFGRGSKSCHCEQNDDKRGCWGKHHNTDWDHFFENFRQKFNRNFEKNPEDFWKGFAMFFFGPHGPWNYRQSNDCPKFGTKTDKTEEEWKEFFSKFTPRNEGQKENSDHWKEFIEKNGPQFFRPWMFRHKVPNAPENDQSDKI